MDTVRQKQARKWWVSKPAFAAYGFVALSTIAFGALSVGDPGYRVSRNTVIVSTVEKGKLDVRVHGNGVLRPASELWQVARVSGLVEQISARAGSVVAEGDLIARLSNPTLLQTADQLHSEIDALVAERQALAERLNSERLDLKVALLRTVRDLEDTRFHLERQTTLINSEHGQLISELDYNRTKLNVKQLDQTAKLERDRIANFHTKFDAELAAKNAQIERLRRQLQRAEEDVAALEVRAPIAGIVQESQLTQGQQVTIGQNMARIIDPASLYAELHIPELQARDLALGLVAEIDTRNGMIAGKVSRIDPAVTNGIVKVDIALSEAVPKGARPDLSIEGSIAIDSIASTLFVRRPAFARPGQTAYLYRMSGEDAAERVQVEFGPSSVSHIAIKRGLSMSDRVITSDTSPWGDPKRVNLK